MGEGKRLYAAYNCAPCHGVNGGGAIGPPLIDDKWIYGASPIRSTRRSRRAGPTACRRSAATSRRSRSGSSSPTSSRCRGQVPRDLRPGAQRRSDGGPARVAAVARRCPCRRGTDDAAHPVDPPPGRDPGGADQPSVVGDVLDLHGRVVRRRAGAARRDRRGRRGSRRRPPIVSSAATSRIAGGISIVALIGAAVPERRHRPRARTRCGRRRAAHPGHRQSVVVGRPVRQPRSRRCASRRRTRSTSRSAGRSRSTCCRNDVIHSLWIPNLQGKIDLVPGRLNELWLQADTPGVYRGQCAEFCGVQHAQDGAGRGRRAARRLRALAGRQPRRRRRRRSTPEQQRGKDVVEQGPCAMCHAHHAARTAGGRTAPDLTHIASRSTIGAGTLPEHARLPRRLDRRSAAHQAGQPHAADRPARRRTAGRARLPGDAEVSDDARHASPSTTRGSSRRARRAAELEHTWAIRRGLIGWLSRRRPQGDRPALHRHRVRASSRSAACSPALMRIQLARPDNTFLGPDLYNQIFTDARHDDDVPVRRAGDAGDRASTSCR